MTVELMTIQCFNSRQALIRETHQRIVFPLPAAVELDLNQN
jgi:hypothetical protein